MNDNTLYWLWFAMALHPGNERIWQMTAPFKTIRDAYEALKDGEHPSLSTAEKRALKTTHIEQCGSVMEYCRKNGFTILTYEDENYPPLLANIYNPPAVLFCMGDIESFNSNPAVTCVGTRRPSVYSLDVTERICSELAKRDFTIVSGFALGLDSAAHIGALKVGGRTAAVLACGLDYNYPKENAAYKSLIAQRGLVISEYFPGTHPDKLCFHTRNRILSGLTFGTIITEADERSGSLITADHAAEQGRTVFCIPPADIFDKRYSGVVKYMRDGAVPVFSHLDVIYDYYTSGYFRNLKGEKIMPELISEDGDIPKRDSRTVKKKKVKIKDEKNTGEMSTESMNSVENTMEWENLLSEMSVEQLEIVDVLYGKELLTDEIIELTGINAIEIFAFLTELEIMGAAKLTDGRKYKLSDIAPKEHRN